MSLPTLSPEVIAALELAGKLAVSVLDVEFPAAGPAVALAEEAIPVIEAAYAAHGVQLTPAQRAAQLAQLAVIAGRQT